MPTPVSPLLWRVRGSRVHLLATIHLGPPGGFELGPTFKEIFEAADNIVFEVGPRDKAFDSAILLRTSSSLETEMGPKLYALLRADPRYESEFETIRPAAVILRLAFRLYTDIGLKPENGVESQLEQWTTSLSKNSSGFETTTEQLQAIFSIDDAAVTRAFEYILLRRELMDKIRDLIVLSYVKGDEDGIRAARAMSIDWSPALAQRMMFSREAKWLPRIRSMIEGDSPTIVAVGAIHLVGRDGLIERLSAAGMFVDRLS